MHPRQGPTIAGTIGLPTVLGAFEVTCFFDVPSVSYVMLGLRTCMPASPDRQSGDRASGNCMPGLLSWSSCDHRGSQRLRYLSSRCLLHSPAFVVLVLRNSCVRQDPTHQVARSALLAVWASTRINQAQPPASCLPGSFSPGGLVADCTPCQPGEYSGATAASSCSACAQGSYADRPRSTACFTCAAGRFLVHPRVGCQTCQAGSFSRPGATICTVCSPGKIDNSSFHDQRANAVLPSSCTHTCVCCVRLRELSTGLHLESCRKRIA